MKVSTLVKELLKLQAFYDDVDVIVANGHKGDDPFDLLDDESREIVDVNGIPSGDGCIVLTVGEASL